MPVVDLRATTIRNGTRIDDIEIAVAGIPPITAYLTGHEGTSPRPGLIAVHGERDDRATHLPEMVRLGATNIACISIDGESARAACRGRDHLTAHTHLAAAASAAIDVLESLDIVAAGRIGAIGWDIGGEALASVAHRLRAIAAIGVIPRRSQFLAEADHPLAAGFRLFHGDDIVNSQTAALGPLDIETAVAASADDTHWLIQRNGHDDRSSDDDWQTLSQRVPMSVRVTHRALSTRESADERRDFLTRLL